MTAPRVVCFDTETALIRPALHAPPLVCVTWQEFGKGDAQIAHVSTCLPLLEEWLATATLVGHNVAYDLAVVAEEFPQLRPAVFRAYDDDRVVCTLIRQQLLDIAAGVYRRKHVGRGVFVKQEYTLEALAKRNAGMQLQKDAWRLSYEAFRDVPLERWSERAREVQANARVRVAAKRAALAAANAAKDKPTAKALKGEIEGLEAMIASSPEQCVKYPLDDARATLAVYLAQEKHVAWLDDQHRQSRAAFWLHLSSAWGIRTDEHGVEVLKRETKAQLDDVVDELAQLGLVREDGSRDTKLAKRRMLDVCRRDGITIPRTKTHGEYGENGEQKKCSLLDGTELFDVKGGHPDCEEHVSLDGDSCEGSEDEVLEAYAEYATLSKVLSNDVAAFERGTMYPIHTRYGLAGTGRTTASKPNIQNVTNRPGMRECFVARPGKVFFAVDFPTLELYTLAQCCVTWFGASKLADALNGGLDAHTAFAAKILRSTYEEVEAAIKADQPLAKKARKQAKPGNFGFPGGMGPRKFVSTTRKQMGREAFAELDLDEARAKKLKEEDWLAVWPEMESYFARARDLCDNPSRRALAETLFTKRFRGQATYCATCNNGFQALGADCAKRAGWLITRAMYVEPRSPLFDSRLVAFVHDEFIGEADEARAHDAGYECARLMAEGANTFLPDVPIPVAKIRPALMRRWSKEAKPIFGVDGRLVPWT